MYSKFQGLRGDVFRRRVVNANFDLLRHEVCCARKVQRDECGTLKRIDATNDDINVEALAIDDVRPLPL